MWILLTTHNPILRGPLTFLSEQVRTLMNPVRMSRRHFPIRTSHKRREHFSSARRWTIVRENKIEEAKRFAFSILASSARYAQAANLFLWNDIVALSKSTFDRGQKILLHPIATQYLENCERFYSEMLLNSIIAFDRF
jgi:hypothetical protein